MDRVKKIRQIYFLNIYFFLPQFKSIPLKSSPGAVQQLNCRLVKIFFNRPNVLELFIPVFFFSAMQIRLWPVINAQSDDTTLSILGTKQDIRARARRDVLHTSNKKNSEKSRKASKMNCHIAK